ncbi:MAG TPA: hypothetical protein VGJ20_19615 [Xanthobacteraceae bacterium]
MVKKPGELPAGTDATAPDAARVVARARWLMIISALTTLIAIAAVAGAIGYRFFRLSESSSGTITNGTVFVPKGAHVVSTTVSGGQIVVTLDVAGASEVRIYDLKTLQQTGRLHFATEP